MKLFEYMAHGKAIVCSDRNFGYVRQILPESSIEQVIVAAKMSAASRRNVA